MVVLFSESSPDDPFIFNPSWVPRVKGLSQGYLLRPLKLSDFEKGFVDVLGQLSIVKGLHKAEFQKIFAELRANPHYVIIVIEDLIKRSIAATGTVLVEKKFLRGGGLVGHIEDIVVDKAYRGKDFGKIIIETLTAIAVKIGCYKVILDCAEHNTKFYEKCGFKRKEVQMVMYREETIHSKI